MKLWQTLLAGLLAGSIIGFVAGCIEQVSAEPFVPEFYMCGEPVHIEGLREAYLQDKMWQMIVEITNTKVIYVDQLLGMHCA